MPIWWVGERRTEMLRIPDFLKRTPTGAKPMAPPKIKRLRSPKRPDATWVWTNDEIERLGSGVRLVDVEKVGRKWVFIRGTGRSGRIRVAKATWDALPKWAPGEAPPWRRA